MSDIETARRPFRGRLTVALLGALLALSACRHVPHNRHDSGDPDVRLAAALEQLDEARSQGENNNVLRSDQRVIVDSDASRYRIRQLALEFPNHGPTLLVNAELAFEAGDMASAQGYLDRLLTLEPDNVFGGIYRARIALNEGNIPLARDVMERQLEMNPDSPHLHEVMASVHFFSGDLTAADKSLVTAGRLGSAEWRVAYHRGLIAEKRGDVEGARRLLRRSSELNPDDPRSRARLIGLEPAK